ncbi:transglycosylase domain-containing protein [Varunaivibrio sulfuroxidans]|uniref:transglycosylase domain-containing protein n=1 Tax=Varunaivibrio sulfuroxidans TaxID=1773489 RepID=UPI00140519D0|nr:PBP1A family penicillin-binding protein [Varunaivibrio sulfuroxidans]WES29585.1 PBP1A family penicillin-binding protein [Varunaivibrio sulfuroxidans]
MLYWGAVAGVWSAIALLALVAYYAYDLPDVETAIQATRKPVVRIFAADGSELARRGDKYGAPVHLRDLPPSLPQAVIATEDRRFYSHFGIDPVGLARAVVHDIMAGGIVQGGSTITQQAAKNLFLTRRRTLKRKVQELLLALWLEHKFTKDQILTIYLNRVYFGNGAYGVDAAARTYFGVSANDLDLYQSALIAGLLKAPSRYNPFNDPILARKRTARVLANMVAAGYLSREDARHAIDTAPRFRVKPPERRLGRYFSDWVFSQVGAYVTVDRDIDVLTTLDPKLQNVARRDVDKLFSARGAARRAGASQTALVTLSPDGAVRAMIGGVDYTRSQFNRVTQAKRQPGSAFKVFVYLAALQEGLRPDTVMRDGPVTIDGWSPKNFGKTYRGDMTLRDALAESVNTIAVKLSEKIGRDKVRALARRLGVTSPLVATPALALGVSDMTVLELTAAYGALVNQGAGVWPFAISQIRDRDGRILYRRSGDGSGRVLDPRTVREMNAMLSRVIEIGTARNAKIDRPAAGKTGTSQDYRDAWFIGYTADYVTGVWMGNDDGRAMRRVTGGGLPARLWHDVMLAGESDLPARPLPAPPDRYLSGEKSPSTGFDLPGAIKGLFNRLFGGGTSR